MMKPVTGVCAALVTPRLSGGALDERGFRRWIEFLLDKDIRGFALNGATGDYCLTTPEELDRLLTWFSATAPRDVTLVCGIGAASAHRSISLGEIACAHGVGLVLLPAPHFFPYGQGDLASFCSEVAGKVKGRILLYNLPQFTSGFAPETTLELVRSTANIVGIKDSSGSLETLRLLTEQSAEACRIVGNDEALAEALKRGCCDAVISGVACAVPELIRELWNSAVSGDADRLATKEAQLAEFIQRIHDLPTPWGLKWIGEIRGIVQAGFPMLPSPERSQHGRELQQWFRSWWTESPIEWAPKQDEVVTGH